MKWPPYSPDLNIIESVWDKMKDYIQEHFPEELTYDQLREAVKEAWDAVDPIWLCSLVESLPEHMDAVIAANGMHIPY